MALAVNFNYRHIKALIDKKRSYDKPTDTVRYSYGQAVE